MARDVRQNNRNNDRNNDRRNGRYRDDPKKQESPEDDRKRKKLKGKRLAARMEEEPLSGTNKPTQERSARRTNDTGKNKRFSDRTERPYKSEPLGEESMPDGILTGRNPVMEALKSGREMTKLLVAKDAEGSIKKIIGMARDKNIIIQYAEKNALDRAAWGTPHQGVVAYVSDFKYCEIEDILAKAADKGEEPFVIILDGIEDPHNLGAIIRTADAAGAHGVIIQKRRAAAVTAVVEKASAGAAEYVPVARVANISQAIDTLKEEGVWIAATDMDGGLYTESNLKGAVALVIGSEGKGISRLVKEKCDFCVSIPMSGGVNSLNASNAAAVLMYEVVRQRNL